MRQDGTANVLWFVTGIAFGTAVGMIAAPRSGADTRRYLRERAGEAGNFIASSGHEIFEKGRELADEAAEIYDEGRHLVEDAEPTTERSL